jgi:predicted dehydrogenase
MFNEQIRLGLIGCGLNMREVHGAQLSQMPQVRVVGLCDPSREALTQMSQAHPSLGELPSYSDYRELLDAVPMDGVVISTPHACHFEQIREALNRDLHVLTEKPLVTRSDHARELMRLRDHHQRVLLVAYQRHYQAEFCYLNRMVQEGKLGRINLMVGYQSENWLATNRNRWRTDPAISGGGVVFDVMSHMLESILWVTGLQPEQVSAHFDSCGTPVEVIATLVIRFAGGAVASVSMNGDTPRAGYDEELCLWGDRGSIRLIWEREAILTEWTPERRSVEANDLPTVSDADTNFVNAIQGLEPVKAPAEWGLRVTLLKEAALESGRSGQPAPVAAV